MSYAPLPCPCPAMRALLVGLAVLGAGCASAPPAHDGLETRHDLVRAFHAHGWTVRPVQSSRPLGVVGHGTMYRVQGKTVVVYDYAPPDEAATFAEEDAGRLLRLHAGLGVEVYRRSSLVVLTVGRKRTAFDLRLADLLSGDLSGPSVASRGWR